MESNSLTFLDNKIKEAKELEKQTGRYDEDEQLEFAIYDRFDPDIARELSMLVMVLIPQKEQNIAHEEECMKEYLKEHPGGWGLSVTVLRTRLEDDNITKKLLCELQDRRDKERQSSN